MILTFCLDSNGSMTFSNKRQTQDVVHREHLLAFAIRKNCRLIMKDYSGNMFGFDTRICDDGELLMAAESDTICFVENVNDISKFINKANTIILYKWNRAYPYDYTFDFSLLADFDLKHSASFKGKSHNEITEEIYERKCPE